MEWLAKRHPDLRPERLGHNLMTDDPFWVRLISDDRLLDIAVQYVGPDVALFASHYLSKPPGDGMPVLWHQDGAYWPLEPMEVVTLWLAVDDSTPENGCMRVIPGTQGMDLQQLQSKTDSQRVRPPWIRRWWTSQGGGRGAQAGDVSYHWRHPRPTPTPGQTALRPDHPLHPLHPSRKAWPAPSCCGRGSPTSTPTAAASLRRERTPAIRGCEQ